MLHNFYFSITLLFVSFFASTQVFASDTVRVFILAGQSNMVGAGEVESNPSRNAGKGSLQWLTENSSTKHKYSHLKTDTGAWVQRDDVLIWCLDRTVRSSLAMAVTTKIGLNLALDGWLAMRLKSRYSL